ncbi:MULTISPECIES: isocitrate lyase/PEP mutase family protein [Roseomonadaceae]|uniref:Isocitrate lyase/phosphoenolpyruvate mutase family protein n=1 Tax=Falsiroseomonas oleicola TaxID=2801474 RepID=A0ABS6HD07_9PROT|nr:isocitrate lyase/phosphoenolpyruvate mutase family protein [Roseomonas oleicola]MBU8546314.1 isocitrate lyase/phosphoenolpyruvate mutase family protein [Roseomonas oleicola]
MTATERRKAFRAVLEGAACVHPASVFDAISGRIAADLGFETAILGGSVASLAVLGAPDHIILTLTEFADLIRRITRAGAPPLLVDADHGYGNALSVMRTVEELETAGVAALTIEDTLLPRPYGPEKTALLSPEEGLGKIRAALAARSDPSLVIIARTSALSVTSTEDAVARATAYAKAGADGIFVTGLTDLAQLDALRAATGLPILVGSAKAGIGGAATLAQHGARVALQGHATFPAAMQAVHATLKALRDGTAPTDLAGLPDAATTKRWQRDGDYDSAIRDFLGG